MSLGLLPVVSFLFTNNKPKSAKIICLYLLGGFTIDLLITPLFSDSVNSQFVGSKIFTLIEFGFLSIFMYKQLILKKKYILFSISSILFAFSFLFENLISSNNNFDSISTGVCALSIILYSIFYLFEKISTTDAKYEFDWISISVISFLIYFSGTFFIYILSKNNFFDQDFQSSYTLINSVILIIRNSLLSIAFFTLVKKTENIKPVIASIT